MRGLNKNARHRASGFSLTEMLIVLAVIIIMASFSFMRLGPLLQQQHVTNAYNTTLAAMRLARDNAVAQRTSYSVTFNNGVTPNTVTVTPITLGFQGDLPTTIYQLPTDVRFNVLPGFPSPGPDKYGTGVAAIDFGYTANGGVGGNTTVFFCPDGSSQLAPGADGSCPGSWDAGVVYITYPGILQFSRAITLWGGSGRLRGWKLVNTGGNNQWIRE